jgi:hypothetical protein
MPENRMLPYEIEVSITACLALGLLPETQLPDFFRKSTDKFLTVLPRMQVMGLSLRAYNKVRYILIPTFAEV